MINRYSVGFVLVVGLAVAGVDYFDQSKKNDLALGQMSLSDYATTIPQRFNAAKDEKLAAADEKARKSAWRRGGVEYLPEAPDGWTRRVLLEGDDSAIMPPDENKNGDGAGQTLLQQMQGREKVKLAKARAARSFVYERGSETVFVEVKLLEKPGSNSMAGLVGAVISGEDFADNRRNPGYDTIGGVGFVESLTQSGARKYHYRVLEGRIGFDDEVRIRVHANAASASTNEILSAIDFDGLNSLLPNPMDMVGNDVDLPKDIDGAELAVAMHDLHGEFVSLRATEAQHRISNIDTNALLVNAYSQQFNDADAMLDVAGGQEMNLSTLIDLAFRKAVHAVRSGKSPAEVKANVTRMVETAVTLADAEVAVMAKQGEDAPAPAMSPELAEELGLAGAASDKARATALIQDDPASPTNALADSPGEVMMQIDHAATEAAGGANGEAHGLQTEEKPKRLELTNNRLSGGNRCVGSFCD